MKRRIRLLRYLAIRSLQYAWQSLKNSARVLLGREPRHDERLIFFRQYFLHLAGFRHIWAITCALDPEGAVHEGSCCQAFAAMWTIGTARACGWTYLHTPFTVIAHADRPMGEWVKAWESVFNLGADEPLCSPAKSGVLNNGYGVGPLDLCFGPPNLRLKIQDCFKALIPDFRRKYYAGRSPRTNGKMMVAVHIRRGDVSEHACTERYTSTENVLRMTNSVKSILETCGIPVSIGVYSQGNAGDFEELSSLDPSLYLDADPIWTLQELVEADILIVAKSYYSYYAGIISDGIKIFEPCGYPESNPRFSTVFHWTLFSELDDWLPCQADGSVDHALLERKLARLLAERAVVAGQPARPTG